MGTLNGDYTAWVIVRAGIQPGGSAYGELTLSGIMPSFTIKFFRVTGILYRRKAGCMAVSGNGFLNSELNRYAE